MGKKRTARQEEAREGAGRGGGGSGARASGPLSAACALLRAEAPSLPSGAAHTRVHVPAWPWLGCGVGGSQGAGGGGVKTLQNPGCQRGDLGKSEKRSPSLRTFRRGNRARSGWADGPAQRLASS